MLLITNFVELRVVVGRSRTRAGSPQAVSRRPCCAAALKRTAWSEHGMGAARYVWIGLNNPCTSIFLFSGTFLYPVVMSLQAVYEGSTDWEFQVSCLHTECFHCRVADHDSFIAQRACFRRDILWRASVLRDTVREAFCSSTEVKRTRRGTEHYPPTSVELYLRSSIYPHGVPKDTFISFVFLHWSSNSTVICKYSTANRASGEPNDAFSRHIIACRHVLPL
jgi:hypothetical protein